MSMSAAIRSSITDFKGLATISLNVNFLAAGPVDLTASAVTTRCGQSTALSSAEVHDAGSRLVATGHGAFCIIRQRCGFLAGQERELGREACRERVCEYRLLLE